MVEGLDIISFFIAPRKLILTWGSHTKYAGLSSWAVTKLLLRQCNDLENQLQGIQALLKNAEKVQE